MKLIPLTQGKFTQVDDEDYDYLMQWKWHARFDGTNWYASRQSKYIKGEKRIPIQMHRVIMKTHRDLKTDHKDHNGLNNQKNNLRICTHAENTRNCKSQVNSSSKYLGVHLKSSKKKNKIYQYWCAQITANLKVIHIGLFKTEENAAIAYNIFAEKYYGEFANYNKS